MTMAGADPGRLNGNDICRHRRAQFRVVGKNHAAGEVGHRGHGQAQPPISGAVVPSGIDQAAPEIEAIKIPDLQRVQLGGGRGVGSGACQHEGLRRAVGREGANGELADPAAAESSGRAEVQRHRVRAAHGVRAPVLRSARIFGPNLRQIGVPDGQVVQGDGGGHGAIIVGRADQDRLIGCRQPGKRLGNGSERARVDG